MDTAYMDSSAGLKMTTWCCIAEYGKRKFSGPVAVFFHLLGTFFIFIFLGIRQKHYAALIKSIVVYMNGLIRYAGQTLQLSPLEKVGAERPG